MAEEHLSYCRICAASCGIVVTVEKERVTGIRGDPDHPGSRGYTCPKGRALGAFHHSPGRLDRPRVRGRDSTWDDTIEDLAATLADVAQSHGPNGLGFYLATGLGFDSAGQIASMTWFAMQGSRQLYTAVTVDNAPVLVAAELVTGSPMLNPVWDPGRPGLLLAFGTNFVVSHGYGTAMADPVMHLRRYRAAGGLVWVLDTRRTETAAHADRALVVRPGSDTAVLGWLCAELLRSGADQSELIERCRAEEVAALRSALVEFTLDRAAGASGVAADDLRDLLEAVRSNVGRLAVMCGTGVTMGRDGVVAEWLRWVLLIITGSLDCEGGMRFNRGAISRPTGPPREPRQLAGPPSRPELPTVIGQYPCVAMVDEIEAGTLRALFIGGGNPLTAFPDPDRTRAALASLDVLAVVDVIDSELTGLATHVLPATAQLERADLTLAEPVSIRSGIQYTPAVLAPYAERRPVWWIFGRLAGAMGGDILGGANPDELTDAAYLAGVLGHSSLDPGEVIAAGPRGIDVPHEYGWVADTLLPDGHWRLAPAELVERLRSHPFAPAPSDGRLLLTNRRDIRRLNSLDYASAPMGRAAEAEARLHPDDASERGLVDGDLALVASDHGTIEVAVRIDPGIARGTVSLGHGRSGANAAALVGRSAEIDPLTTMPLASGLPVAVSRAGSVAI